MGVNPVQLERFQALLESDPEGAQKLLQAIADKTVIPHEGGQRDVLEHPARFQVLNAGRRWGKTKLGAKKAIHMCRARQKQTVWWVAPTYKVVKRGYAEILRQLPTEILSKPPAGESSFEAGRSVVLRFKNGSKMEFFSAERPEGMLGEGVDFAVVDEAAIIPMNVWDQIIRPTLMDRQGGALLISTPRGKNWFYNAWLRGQGDNPEWKSWKFPTSSNPHIRPEEIEEMESTLPAAIYEQEVEADFVSNAASVFRFKEESVVPLEKPDGHVFVGIDLAKSRDFTVLTGVNGNTRRPCWHERFNAVSWPEQLRRIVSAVTQIIQAGATQVTLAVDSTGVGDPIVDDLEYMGYDVIGIKFTNQWKHQAVMLLGSDLERGEAFLNEEQVLEFESYAYEHNVQTGRITYAAPQGAHDDEVSAKLLQHWVMVNIGSPNVVTLGAQDGLPELTEGYVDAEAEEIPNGVPSTADLLNNPNAWF